MPLANFSKLSKKLNLNPEGAFSNPKVLIFFLISPQNISCGYSLEVPDSRYPLLPWSMGKYGEFIKAKQKMCV